jgi:hypothetical protein
MTTSLLPQANKMEEEAQPPTIDAKGKGTLYSPPYLPRRK